MTVEEIFKNLASHMKNGIIFHQELADYYDFLNLCGYSKCHEYHYYEEIHGYKKLCHYYMEHFNKLIQKEEEKNKKESIIPSSWYNHKRIDIDTQLKRQSVQMGIKAWINWEKETKKLYENSFKALMQQNQIAAALFLKCYIFDVDEELKYAEKKQLNMKAVNYDINSIISCQQKLYKKYKEKIKE